MTSEIAPDTAPHTEQTVLQILDAAARLERNLDSVLSNARGVSFNEYRLLRTLALSFSGDLPRIELANSLGVTASAVTRALKPMEKLGLIKTVKSERDARQNRAAITTSGRALLDDAQNVLQDYFSGLALNDLGPQEVDTLRHILSQLNISR
ncbi:MAG: MarR family transcriptional regulator [Pseudomonadota bacterium]